MHANEDIENDHGAREHTQSIHDFYFFFYSELSKKKLLLFFIKRIKCEQKNKFISLKKINFAVLYFITTVKKFHLKTFFIACHIVWNSVV